MLLDLIRAPSQHQLSTFILFYFGSNLGIQDPGAFAIAQALKANEDIAVTSLNLANNFLTKFGQVVLSPSLLHPHLIMI